MFKQNIVALATGLLFGFGLALSQMTDPRRVLGFLDMFGDWDPTLAFVMGGAVAVTLITFRWVLRRPHPLFAARFHLPTRRDIDAPLLAGASLFGIGWGLSGFCPGPGIAALVIAPSVALLFVAAMLSGMLSYQLLSSRWSLTPPTRVDNTTGNAARSS